MNRRLKKDYELPNVWYVGEVYEVSIGKPYSDDGYNTLSVVSIRNKKTGKIVKRVGEGKPVGNYHPVWVNWKGKKITVEKLLDLKR